jgi:hypothetical protein
MGVSVQRYAQARFTPEERIPGTHCTEGWVGPRAGLDTEARGKLISSLPGMNLDRPVKSVARHYTVWATRLKAVEATGLKIMTSRSPSMAWSLYWIS